MSDDDKSQPDAGRMSAPPPDFDEDDVTRLTPGDELARWRRIAAGQEPAPITKAPEPPPSRPSRPGASPSVGADGATPPHGVPAVESTPTRAIAVPVFGEEPAHVEAAVSPASLRDAPISFPPRAHRGAALSSSPPPRASSSPPRATPMPDVRAAPLPSNRPVGLTSSAPQGTSSRPLGVFGAPRRDDDEAAPLPLTERRSVPPGPSGASAPPPTGAFAAGPSLPPMVAPRGARALAPPPPSLSLPPRHDPSIPPHAPLGFDQPTRSMSPAAPSPPAGGGRAPALMIALVIVFGAIGAGLYLARNAGLTAPALGGTAPPPIPPRAAPAAFGSDAALADAPASASALPGAPTPPPLPPSGAEPGLAEPVVPGSPLSPPTVPEVAPGAPFPTASGSPTPSAVPELAPSVPSGASPGSLAALPVAELLASADAALRGGDAEAALEGYRAVIAADGDNPYGYAGAARASLALDEPEDAISFATRAVAHRQRRAGLRVLLGDAYEAHGEHERAQEEWRAALEIEPENRDARTRLGE